MTKKRMLADVLWEAANERLSPNDIETVGNVRATCCAAWWAEHGREWWMYQSREWRAAARESQAVQFLKQLGCRVGSSAAFNSFDPGEERQGVRYMWLLLAMHVAEDEGIEL
jgi:hypothetical protein